MIYIMVRHIDSSYRLVASEGVPHLAHVSAKVVNPTLVCGTQVYPFQYCRENLSEPPLPYDNVSEVVARTCTDQNVHDVTTAKTRIAASNSTSIWKNLHQSTRIENMAHTALCYTLNSNEEDQHFLRSIAAL